MTERNVVRLGDVLAIQNGFAFDSKRFGSVGTPLIRIRDLKNGTITETRYDGEYDARYVVRSGDLLIGMDGEFRVYQWQGGDALLNQRVCRLEEFDSNVILQDYLRYALDVHLKEVEDHTGFTTVKHLSAKTVLDLRVSLPPLHEQKRIVAKLDEVSLLSDRLELNSTSQLANCKELRAKLLAGVFSEHAPLVPLGDLVEVLDSRRVPITKKDRVPGDVPYYGATGVQDFVADFLFDEALVLLGEDGAKWSAGDRSAFLISGKTWVNNHAHVLRPDRSKVLDEWLAEWLCVADLVPYTSGATVQKLNQARMKEILVPVPPIERQRSLTARVARIHADTQMFEANATAMLAEVALLRKATLASLLSGAS